MSQNPFAAVFSRQARRGDPKKMGICGAPQCHCTPLLMALCVALTGLVFVGVGSCIIGFMGNDEAPKILGASFTGIGLLMMLAGGVFFVYDNYLKSRFPIGDSTSYPYQPHESTQFDQPSTSYGAASPSASDGRFAPPSHDNPAPPAYDAVLKEKTDSRLYSKAGGSRAKASLAV